MFFVIFLLTCILGYLGLTRLFPRFLAWTFKRKFRLDVDIGRIGIGIWYFTLRDVKLSKNHVCVHIDEIGFRSSFFSSEVAKLVSLVIKDVRIDVKPQSRAEPVFGPATEFNDQQKIPPAVITFVQFMAVHVYNISVMFLRAESPEWLIHASAKEVHLDGSIIHNARTLLVNMSVTSTTAKFLKHAVESDPQPCLIELAFGINMEATVIAQGPLSVEKLYIGMENPQAVVHDAIYSFAQRSKQASIPTTTSKKILKNYLPIIPKNVNVKVENIILNGMRDDSKIDFSASLKSLLINTQVNQSTSVKPLRETFEQSQIFLSFQMDNFDVQCRKNSVVEMTKLSVDGTYEENSLNVYVNLNKLTLSYEHVFMNPWVVNNFLQRKENVNLEVNRSDFAGKSWLDSFTETCQISGNVELRKVCVWCHLPGQVTSIGFQHTKFSLEKSQDDRPFDYDSLVGRLLFGKRHWTMELLVESSWCRMGHSLLNNDARMLKKYHTWGTPLYIGVVFIKARSQSTEVKINAMIDLFRTEWSPQFATVLLQCLRCANEYRTSGSSPRMETANRKQSTITYSTSLACTNSNLYWLAENSICLMLRIDNVTVDCNKGKIDWVLDGITVASVKPAQFQHSCVKSEEIKLTCAHVKNARINYMLKKRELSLKLQERVQIKWSTNLHLKIKTLYEEFINFLRMARPNPSENTGKNKPTLNWVVKVNGDFQLHIVLSRKHEAYFVARELAIGKNQMYSGLETELLKIAVDNAEIFTFSKLEIRRNNDDALVREERKRADGLTLESNLVWFATIDSFKACFPFTHNYADAIQGEFISTWKWLKQTHRSQKTEIGPLPSDIHIEIGQFLFEMSDDPFEVKLRDNYVLFEDEYKESLKRKTMLDAKLEKLSQTHLLSKSHDKVEELYEGLCKKNVEIYIQRSKQMKRQSPARTRLFAWMVSDFQLIALADPALHGKENVVKMMAAIDPESPWPEEGLEFSTLWCRSVYASFKKWEFQLRDFPQPLMYITDLEIFGMLVGAEQMATKRARRTVSVDLGEPWGQATVERSMTPLKFYHDLNCRVDKLRYAFGPCWEPVIAQCNLSFEKILPPSRDPSPALPWWDKMRLLFHGQLTMYTQQLTMLLHASLDPYNTTEEMELTWERVAMDWTNGKFVFHGDFDVYVRTASKYDDCRLLHLPRLKLTVKLTWVCLWDANDHHAVMPCAPDKLPEYSSNQERDSFRAFRSQNLNVTISLETKAGSSDLDCPSALLYGSTLRWFENLKLILSGVTRPTRRGAVFNNLRAKKKQLSRHYRKVRILIGIHRFQVFYWMSFAMQRGFELLGGRVTFSSEHILNLASIDDGLLHRPRSEWSVSYMNCDLNDAEIWLKSALQDSKEAEPTLLRQPVEKCYCLSVVKVSYGRETVVSSQTANSDARDTPTHRLVVYDLKGAWTKSNRDVAFALFDTFIKSKQLKKNLSTEALKGFRGETTTKSRPSKTAPADRPPEALLTSPPSVVLTTSPLSSAGTAASMLQQLIAEVEIKPVVFSDDLSVQTTGQRLQGLQACQEDDVTYKNWLISLINSQVLLKGCETKGYVIMSAAKAEILQRVHNPVWKDRTLVSKTTWVGSLDCMQYYATVAAGGDDAVDENIMWLTLDNIEEKEPVAEPADVVHLVGSGQSVGGVVTETVGASCVDAGQNGPVQLQRIVSRCKCEFFYAAYGDTNIDPSTLEAVPAQPLDEGGLWEKKELAVDAFTLMHHDLDVCTNSLQYAMILDIVNHLLLNVEPQRKESYERLQRMRFELALHSSDDERKPIQDLQNQVRSTVAKLRRLEKQTYLVQKAMADSGPDDDPVLLEELRNLNADVDECKELLTAQSDELHVMLSCYKESQLSAYQKLATMKGDKTVTTIRANEIVFKHAKWRLTDADGLLGIADLVLSNFLYTKNSRNDDSVEHLLELGYINVINLLPNQIYEEVLKPSEIQSNMPVDRKTAVRVFCREKAPVGGLSVKEHFEINVVPMTIGLTKKFYNIMMNFCFPGRDPDTIDGDEDVELADRKKAKTSGKKTKETNFYVKIEAKDDVEKMKERAEKNKIFIYIKIPEVPVKVSYKGNKEKNVEDMRDFRIVIPTLEYHNVTWTWLDLLLAMKTDCRKVILTQAIKQKLTIKGKRTGVEEGSTPAEEDKARILFGTRATNLPPTAKSSKKSVLKLTR